MSRLVESLQQIEQEDPLTRRRKEQQEKRLSVLGATDATAPTITAALDCFDAREFSKAIPARDELYKRLVALTQGQTVPLVVFNCLDFAWEKIPGTYPAANILDDTSLAICGYFQDTIQETVEILASLSQKNDGVDLCVIIPDSELFDTRVFPFSQTAEERIFIAEKVKSELAERLAGLGGNPVMFWSEYCEKYGLVSPMKYTAANADRLTKAEFADNTQPREKNIYQGLRKQIVSSAQYFVNNGLAASYVQYEIPYKDRQERTLWYCAMYMGEGQALADSGALVLNLEDLRVSKWYNIGSNDNLPILTPVNPSGYYRWRNLARSTLPSQGNE